MSFTEKKFVAIHCDECDEQYDPEDGSAYYRFAPYIPLALAWDIRRFVFFWCLGVYRLSGF